MTGTWEYMCACGGNVCGSNGIDRGWEEMGAGDRQDYRRGGLFSIRVLLVVVETISSWLGLQGELNERLQSQV